ncbi:MAG: hypothetical protein DMG38_29795 [Acidobacteria bacterium]|nr:MAG: hypothetical protein DMG38_29795 [Acidobacteriota bacterium]
MVSGPMAKHRRWKIPNCANVVVTGPQVLDSRLTASVGGDVANCPHLGLAPFEAYLKIVTAGASQEIRSNRRAGSLH